MPKTTPAPERNYREALDKISSLTEAQAIGLLGLLAGYDPVLFWMAVDRVDLLREVPR